MSDTLRTLCWDCRLATSRKCPWADRGKAVPGWWAKQTKYSFCVYRCPMFDRDAEDAGQKKWEPKPSILEYVPLKGEKDGISDHSESGADGAESRMAESRGSGNMDCGGGCLANQRGRETRSAVKHNYILDLAFVILERAVEDWKALDYGARAEVMIDGCLVNRKEVVRFFFSEWFKHLVDVTEYSESQFRALIRIPEDALEVIETADARRRFQ